MAGKSFNYDDDILSDIPKVQEDSLDINTVRESDSFDIMDYKKNQRKGDEDMKIASGGRTPSRRTGNASGRTSYSRSTSSGKSARTGNYSKGKGNGGKKMGCFGKLIYLAAILAVSVLLSVFAVNVACDVFGIFQQDSSVSVTIPENSTKDDVVEILYEKKIIEHKWAFNIIQKLKKVSIYKGGEDYVLNHKSDYNTIIKKLLSTNVERKTVTITFPEGYSLDQMLELLEEKEVCSVADMKSQMNSVEYDYTFMDGMSSSADILYKYEGYLFPDTYDFYVEDTPQSVYGKFLSNLENKLEEKYYTRAKELGMTMNEALTLASVIQKESSNTEQMANVSSVFHNRLNINKKLQSDVTVWYPYYKKSDVPTDIVDTYKSKYNTYSIEGLPPGPICNPGIAAIQAALYPAETNYYYFVTDVNGKYYYAASFEEHERNCAVALSKGEIGGTETE